MPIRFLNTVDLTVTSSILKTDANGVIVAAVAGTDYINTVTSAMVTTALGYTPVPTTRTLTINGTALDLSADRSWTISTITGNAGSATVLQTARTLTIGNTGKTFNGSANVSWTLAEIGAYAATNPSGYITSSGNISGYAGSLEREDNRTISPSELTAGRLKFGFTSWSNNNTAPYADFLHLRSYTDASGGNDNLVMFRKDAIGMRVWQQSWGSATAYSSFKDVAFTDSSITGNAGSATVLQTARTINGTSFNGSADITTANWGTARTITIGNTGKSVNGSANVTWTLAEIGAQAALTNPVTGTGTTNYLPKFTGATTIGNSQVFDNGTNVGIGTTSPSQKLHVVGNGLYTGNLDVGHSVSTGDAAINLGTGRTGNGFAYIDLIGDTTYTDYGLRILRNNGGANTTSSIVHRGTGDFSIQNNEAANLVFLTAATERMRITSAGNVGIGTTAPSSKLDVQLSSYDGITLSRAAQSGGSYIQGRSYDTSNVFRTSARIVLGAVAATNAADGFITFNTYSANTENERMRITSAGNVGIGTTSPTNQLTVTTATNAVDVVRLNNTGGDSGSVQGVTHLAINHFNSGTNPSTRITAYQDGVSGWPGGMYFSTRSLNTDSAPVERMRITSTGNVGIGTSSPNALYRTTITTGAGQTGALQTTGSVNINSGALAVGSITPSGTAGRIDASNDIVAFSTSDRRFKENITPISNALDKVKTLTGVEFDWKQETKDYHGYVGHDVGVIAQEVQAVLPEAVRTNHNGYLSVRYEKMIALLVEANKELAARVEELEKKLK